MLGENEDQVELNIYESTVPRIVPEEEKQPKKKRKLENKLAEETADGNSENLWTLKVGFSNSEEDSVDDEFFLGDIFSASRENNLDSKDEKNTLGDFVSSDTSIHRETVVELKKSKIDSLRKADHTQTLPVRNDPLPKTFDWRKTRNFGEEPKEREFRPLGNREYVKRVDVLLYNQKYDNRVKKMMNPKSQKQNKKGSPNVDEKKIDGKR